MKKMIEKEMTFCDECEKGDYVYKCMGCGIEYCYDCRKLLLKEYQHEVYFTGSGDGYFCKDCDINPPAKVKKIHSLYKAVEMLKNEVSGYYNITQSLTNRIVVKLLEEEYDKMEGRE